MPDPSPTRILLAQVYYDAFTEDIDTVMSVEIPPLAAAALATLTDFELKVTAAEAAIRVKTAIELPPSPPPTNEPSRS